VTPLPDADALARYGRRRRESALAGRLAIYGRLSWRPTPRQPDRAPATNRVRAHILDALTCATTSSRR